LKIGIVGAGQIGSTLARKFSSHGHSVSIANSRDPETIADVAAETRTTAVWAADAVKNVDVVILSIPEKNVPQLGRALLANIPDDVVIVDTGNYYPGIRDGRIEAIEGGLCESRWVSDQLGRRVVKAFNSITASSLACKGLPAGVAGRIALPLAADDSYAKKVVIELIDAAGFDAIDAGRLDDSWRQQPGTPAYCTDWPASELAHALANADRAQAPQMRDLAIEMVGQLPAGYTNEDIIKTVRSLFK
jgi:predicted dinucleotide-binding enzyme